MGASAFPRLEQLLDVAPLLIRELEPGDKASRFGGIVVLDRGLQVLAERRRLCELAAQPAEEAHLGGFNCHMGGDGLEPPTPCV